MEEFKLYDIDSAELTELIDVSRIRLKEKSPHYKELTEKIAEIIENNPNILALIEENEVESLNKEECKLLQKLITLHMQMTAYEDREIFFLGARENYFYFKNLEILK